MSGTAVSPPAAALAAQGATNVSRPEVAAEAGVLLFSSLSDGSVLEAVAGSNDELLRRLGPGGVAVSVRRVGFRAAAGVARLLTQVGMGGCGGVPAGRRRAGVDEIDPRPTIRIPRGSCADSDVITSEWPTPAA